MHHKYCVIDNRILMTGSFNWTVSAGKKNYENVLITTNKKLVKLYQDYYNSLWNRNDLIDINKSKTNNKKKY